MHTKKNNKQAGVVLIISVLVVTALLLAGSYLINIANSEQRISNAQAIATKNYYLAESAINEMAWRIKNDATLRNAFLSGTLNSSYDINRSNVFGDSRAAYQVSAVSTVTAEAQIIATSTYAIGNSQSQRVIKAYIVKATGSDNEWEFSTFAGGRGSQQNGNFTFKGSGITFVSNGGRVHANQEVKIQGTEVVINDGIISASNVINVVAGGVLTLNNSIQDSPTTTIDMLQIDFDSGLVDSWENRATTDYSSNEFKNLPNNTILNGIIYVDGDAEIKNKNFTINGVLVAGGNIEIDLSAGQSLAINADSIYGGGMLSKADVTISASNASVYAEGLIYAADYLHINSNNTNFLVYGSLTGFDAEITANGSPVVVYYTPENFQPVINPIYNQNSPLIQIDHWEEEY